MCYIEVYNPSDAAVPLITTEPRHMTPASAENDIIAALAVMANR